MTYVRKFVCWEFLNEIDLSTCKKIINLGENKWKNSHNESISIANVKEKWVHDLALKYMKSANKNSGWDIQSSVMETMQLRKIDVDPYNNAWNIDGDGFTRYDRPDSEGLNGRTRKLSMNIILNDDYEGGELEFFNNKKLIEEKTGTIVVFPSYMVHRVNPVTKGVRYSLSVWFIGQPFK